MKKKDYIKPLITRMLLDNTISLQMASQPTNPPPRSGGSKSTDAPFASPFGDKPFS